ncbi:MAG: peptide chain release factor N(5)-glutamine methyltransferase [Acidobacteriia bacterium]|nr:peptide chain release factor N(5)-glutamine methyltransferase [Terriglobia bacterium]
MDLAEALTLGKKQLAEAGTPSPSLNAEVLMQRLLGVEKVRLISHSERGLTPEEEHTYFSWIVRRSRGEPAQYITGHQEFWGLDFEVTSEVLIPRPETEHLIETVLELNQSPQPQIVDVGTGSGCIAIALAKEIPGARLVAVDQSRAALNVAARNAERLGVCDRIEFVNGDLLAPLHLKEDRAALDFVVSNPPYVPPGDRETLAKEVRDHEPPAAIYSPESGPMTLFRRLIRESAPLLRQGGYLVMEIGAGQKPLLQEEFSVDDWQGLRFVNDLQSIPRVVAVQRR